MERQRVNSSNIQSIGYDASVGTLEVEFHTSSIYQYFNVPDAVYEALMRAPSKGAYLNDFIKDRFRYRQIR